jgi:Glycosyltransferase family 87
LVAAGAVVAAAAWLCRASLQQDFAAYWVAGAARRAGLDPYVNHVGKPGLWDGVAVFAHSRFLYAPLVAELFRPLAALPYLQAKSLFTAASVVAWAWASAVAARAFGPAERRRSTEVALALGCGALFFPLYLHLERGQIDLFALLLLLAAWIFRARAGAAGAALAAAAALKPALAGVLPVVVALGRWRAVAAAVAWAAVLGAVTLVVSGPALLVEYVTQVLPRAARYGEGGTAEMLLPPARLEALAGALDADAIVFDGRSYRAAVWEGPASASLPRLLAPDGPAAPALVVPSGAALVGLIAAARVVSRRRRAISRRQPACDAEALVFFAAAVACVVASPSGWTMGLVVALPMAPIARAARASGALGRAGATAIGLGLLACACPPPFPGFAALAGAALVVAAAIAAAGMRPPAVPGAAPDVAPEVTA